MKFSIIVPIYNVESFLPKCYNSIQSQTFRDFEIILVDDGSTDSCPSICDIYSEKNSNTKVIHKENGGLSDARNEGLKKAEGEFVFFIDSDDYVESNLLELCLQHLNICNDIDIVNYGFKKVSENGMLLSEHCYSHAPMTGEKAMLKVIEDEEIFSFAWANVYRKTLFDGIHYPEGRFFEDKFTTYKIFSRAKMVAFTGLTLLFYVQRAGSISNNNVSWRNAKGCIDSVSGLVEQYNYLLGFGKNDVVRKLEQRIRTNMIVALRTSYKYKYYEGLDEIEKLCKNLDLSKQKSELLLFYHYRNLYSFIMFFYRFIK